MIHESFANLSRRAVETDRLKREATELTSKLGQLGNRHLDTEQLQADLLIAQAENKQLDKSITDLKLLTS